MKQKRYIYFIYCFLITLILFIQHTLLFAGPQKEFKPVPGNRSEIILNGEWEVQHTKSTALSPPGDKWDKSPVPCLFSSLAVGGSQYTWYRRTITIPQSWQNHRVFVYLTGARFDPHVYINNKFCGSQLDGWIPFEVEITDAVVPGESYTLSVRCQDWGATFEEGYSLPENASTNWDELRGMPKGKILAPIGGLFTYYGVWDDVCLCARPRAHLFDITVDTSIRKKMLTVRGDCSYRGSGFYVEGEILDGDNVVLPLARINTGPGGKWSLSSPAAGLKYWSPENPYLYTLKVYFKGIEDHVVMDTFQTRFGFRELWAEGPDFYLNGIKLHLLASSGWPVSYYQTDEEIRSSLQKMKEGNNKAFRFHTQPWQSKWLDIADEVGMLIVEEGALWCDWNGAYMYKSGEFWKNAGIHLEGMVKRDRNHPCLVMWSLENEILHCGACQYGPDAEEKLAQLGQRVKQLDPTHLITYEADHDPGGIADVIGLHYPHEMPAYTDYPNTADWLGQPVVTGTGGGALGAWGKEFTWDRKKPLYIGEYLWIPENDFSPGTVFFGDDAYINMEDYKLQAKALSWEYQTLAYRRAGVSGMCPWTFAGSGGIFDTGDILFMTQKRIYQPVAAFPRDAAVHFFAGEKISRVIDLFNDSATTQSLTLRCTLEEQKVYEKIFELKPGDHEVVIVPVSLPDTVSSKTLLFSIDLFTGTEKVHSSSQNLKIYKKQDIKIPAGYTLLFFDPVNAFSDKAKLSGFKSPGGSSPVKLDSLNDLTRRNPDSDILIIGPYAFKEESVDSSLPVIGSRQEDLKVLIAFAKNGGRVFIMEQETLLGLSAGMSLVQHASTLTFPVNISHPLFSGLSRDDFCFWQPTHDNETAHDHETAHYHETAYDDVNYVTKSEILRPGGFGARSLLVSGGVRCIDQSPLVEQPFGQGRIIFCQALVGTKYRTEPVAQVIIQNALNYFVSLKPIERKTIVLSQGDSREAFTDTLEKLGVSFTHYDTAVRKEDIQNASLIILHGGGGIINSSASLLQEYLRSPLKNNILYWHLPDKESFGQLRQILGLPHLSLEKGSGPLTLRGMDYPLFAGVCREDIVYIDQQIWTGSSKEIILDPRIVDSVLSLKQEPENSIMYETEEWTLEGQLVYVSGNKKEVIFATNGTAGRKISVKKPGLYQVSLKASGSQTEKVWPFARIDVNGTPQSFLEISGEKPSLYSTLAEFPQGDVLIEISFINDLYSHGQDRNLYIDAFLMSKEPVDTKTIQFLTLPAGVVECRVNESSRVIIDTIQWHTNGKNRLKGLRYASVLMANIGASFTVPGNEPEWISAGHFSEAGEISYFNQSKEEIVLYSAGTIKAEFYCTREGTYNVLIRAYSTEVDGVYSRVRVTLDDTVTGEAEIRSPVPDVFPAGSCFLGKGEHSITIAFINDLYQDGADRNLFIQGIGFE